MKRALTARNVDATVQRYLGNILSVLLNIALVVALLGYFPWTRGTPSRV
jgi:small conductance mechanosensitive channel